MELDRIKRAAFRRKRHVRAKIVGNSQRPRLTVFRSNRHVYAQLVDDVAAVTLVAASTKSRPLRDKIVQPGNIEAAFTVGEFLGKQAVGVGINCASFDRGGYKYHGRVKALAEGARKAGLVL